MDQVKIGKFIAELRKEKNYTQEFLGEKIGVTNKTISRWENGHYLPDIEMLQLLSKEFSVTINELISGERLEDNNYKEKAEENLLSALDNSTFTLKEKTEFYRKKWLKEHIFEIIVDVLLWIILIIFLKLHSNCEISELGLISGILIGVIYIINYNKMMKYIEDRVYNINNK